MNVIVGRHSLLSSDLKHSAPLQFRSADNSERLPREINSCIRARNFYTSRPGVFETIFRKKPEKMGEGSLIFEARLPSPAVLITGQPIPVTLLIKRDSGDVGNIVLDTIELTLSSITTIRIRSYQSTDETKIPLLSRKNLALVLPMGQRELVVQPTESGSNGPVLLPHWLLQSFRSCNITRKYSMIMRLVIRHQLSTTSEEVRLTKDVHLSNGVSVTPLSVETAEDVGEHSETMEESYHREELPPYKATPTLIRRDQLQ